MSINNINLLAIAVFMSVFAYANDPVIPFDENVVTVFDADVNDPLPGVSIYNVSRSFTAFTNEKGQADISGLALSDTLFFDFLSFDKVSMAIKDIRKNNNQVHIKSSYTSLGEVIVYGYSKQMERSDDIPPIVEVIGKDEIQFTNPQTSADMLANTVSVFVQKSQMGGGSPIIRGFEANKLLIILDGVRMNNAIYRAGHLQNVISIDNSILEKTEIIYGPASVIYGSDALGGVMHFYTKKPKYHAEGDKKWEVNAMTRLATANLEKTAHVDANFGNEKWATLLSVSYSDFDDLMSGRIKSKDHPEGYGELPFYVGQANGRDSIFTNPNPFRQFGTAYGRLDLTQKTRFKPHKDIDVMLNLQYATTTDVPRYDQLTEGNFVNDEPFFDFKFAEWDYGPQSRFMAALSADIRSTDNLFDEARLMTAFQKIDEDRITRNFDDNWEKHREENVYVYSLNADLNKQLFRGLKVFYGGEFTYNRVNSIASRTDISTGMTDTRLATRYPDGGSNMTGFAIYTNFNSNIKKGLNLMGGVRYSHITLSSRFVDTTFIKAPYQDGRITLNTPAFTGSVGMAWDMGKGFHLHTVASNAFRAPNVDDVGKIRSKNGFVILPTSAPEGVVAEKSLNAELSLAKNFNNKVRVSGTYFYTYLFDAIVQRRDSVNGEQTIYYDGSFDTIQTNINAGEAFIYGTSATLLADLSDDLQFKGSINYTFGHNISDSGPLAHIPPVYGLLSLNYQKEKTRLELVSRFNGKKILERYSDNSSDNLDKATPTGTPSWYTLNLYTAHQFSKQFRLTFGIENILDKHYRPFSSGVSAAGRNFMIGLQGSF